jgi:hypothetical protein
MTRTILNILGTILVVLGIAGFVSPHLAGTHLSATRNFIHIGSGALALWFGLKGSLDAARMFSWIFAALYGLLGLAGMVFGQPGVASVVPEMGSDPKLLRILPEVFEVGRNDHILHMVIALAFALAAMMARHSRPARREAPAASG